MPNLGRMRRIVLSFIALVLVSLVGSLVPAAASHSDGTYEIPVWFYWDESTLDVLVVPPNHGQIFNDNGALNGGDPREATPFNSYLRATEDSIADWDKAVSMFAPEWLKTGLVTNVYVVGRDSIPGSALTDPEVLIVSDETKANILGIAVSTDPCIVDNSKFFTASFTYEDMYNINAQEYGHCLGLEHVVDNHPGHDAMAGLYLDRVGAKGTHLHCVSNLDVKGLESVFGALFGKPTPKTVSVPVAGYGTTCSMPSSVPTSTPGPTPTPSPSSTPAPSQSPSASPSPQPSTSPGEPRPSPSHDQQLRTVTLRLRRHLVARGKVIAADGYSPCQEGVRVQVQVLRNGAWKLVAETDTGSSGAFRVRVPDRPRRYRSSVDATDECSSAVSGAIRHRHR